MLCSSCERNENKCERSSPIDTKVREDEKEVLLILEQKFLLQPLEETVVNQAVPLQPREDHAGTHIHAAACGALHVTTLGDVLEEDVACVKPMQEQPPGSSCGLRETHTGTVCS